MTFAAAAAIGGCGPSSSGTPTSEPSSSEGGQTADVINVGALFNVTGGQASLDEPGNRGFKLAVDQINADGGINGRQINMVAYDGKTDQTTCANNTRRMIDVDQVLVIGGLSDSNYAMAAGQDAQTSGVPMVFSGATTPSLADQIGDQVFLTAFGDDTCGYAAAEYAYNDMKLTKAYLLIDQSMEFTKTLAQCFQERYEQLGGEIVLTDNYMNKDPDFSSQITRYQNNNNGAEFLFFSGVPDDAGPLIQQFREKGVTEPIISGDGFDTPLLWEVAGTSAEGVIVATHCSFENEDPQVQQFVTDYNAAYGVPPENAFAALGYDCMMIIREAIEKSGDDVTSANIRDNLEQIDGLKCVTGTISYKNGHVPDKSVTINEVKDGAFAFVTVVD
jgi:branched-chain amino acid transport system substrate-binding protein